MYGLPDIAIYRKVFFFVNILYLTSTFIIFFPKKKNGGKGERGRRGVIASESALSHIKYTSLSYYVCECVCV